MINLALIEKLEQYAQAKAHTFHEGSVSKKFQSSTYWKSGFKKGYSVAMAEMAEILAQTIQGEINEQNEMLKAMYEDEFGEDK